MSEDLAVPLANCADDDRQSPKIVVLLAAYNGMEFIAPQVSSILQQQGIDVTLVVSVDESTDGTRQWVESISKTDQRVRLMPPAGRFGSASANFFNLMSEVAVRDYDFVALSDQDDIWLPNKLESAVKAMHDSGSAGYSGSVWAWHENGRLNTLNKAGPQRKWDHLFSSPGPGCTHVLEVEIFTRLQQMLLSNRTSLASVDYHDWLDYAFVRQQGLKWHIDSQPHMLYRQHSSNQLGANVGFRAKVSRIGALRRGWMWNQARLICELVEAQNTTPYKLLIRPRFSSRLGLVALSPRFRRSFRDAAALAISFLATRSRPNA